jgi:redox-sensitive bicupin YhaK (pirin superfamily)
MNGWEVRRSATRGAFANEWLDARFSFSFGDYDDPFRRRFWPLIALNEDRVRPGTGFPMHPHRGLEIVSPGLRRRGTRAPGS